jgi:hypothetical protein
MNDPHVGGVPGDCSGDQAPTRTPLGPAALEDAAYWAALARSAAHNAIGQEGAPDEHLWLSRAVTFAQIANSLAAIANAAAAAQGWAAATDDPSTIAASWREVLSP